MTGVLEQVHGMKDSLERRSLELSEEIRSLSEERQEVENFLSALGGGKKTTRRRSGGTRRSGGRKQEFLTLVKERPGITVSEAAKEVGIHANYLYRLSSDLQKKGVIVKKGQGYEAVEETPAEEEKAVEPATA